MHRPTEAERNRAVHVVHRLRCECRMSIRAIAEELAKIGIHRSRGAVYRDLSLYWCRICAPQPAQQEPRRARPEVYQWR